MNQPSYLFTRVSSERYVFVSSGKQEIEKAVEFTAMEIPRYYNIGFGDQLPNGTLDDTVGSNNGDIIKVLATVVKIIVSFLSELPDATIFFVGSSSDRTRLYRRILRNYYYVFSNEYLITALVLSDGNLEEVSFDPSSAIDYHAFFVRKNT
ncbi:hypothetical protein [uncultured Chitinophaga sp.]|jgi:hypothetical protein|uniref:DUF6934 family protein n=1 Tax=uncultured Chitinophaga sp. TaxID=339340 RepID=UPI0026167D42|nr:hypothetical protein [uncultured Chitinophaga sp.]